MRTLFTALPAALPSTVQTAVLAAALMAVALLTLSGCELMTTISDGSLRTAASRGAAGELERLGHRPAGALTCSTPSSNTRSVVKVECSGRTTRGERIEMSGIVHDADTASPHEWYVITVDGRDVLRKGCLDVGCGTALKHR